MMLSILKRCFFTACFLMAATSYAQTPATTHNDNKIRLRQKLLKTTIASPLEELYDVHYVKLDLAMTNLSTAISGNAITTATVVAAGGMSQYAFELTDSLTIDSIKFNGAAVTAASNGLGLRTITLPATLAQNTQFRVQTYYHGGPPVGTGFFDHGLVHGTLSTGTQILYTMSDPYLAQDWWPCKQSLTDKVDSADLWITVANPLKAGCNGILQQVTPVGAGNSRYEWKTRYPIDYYLISASVAPYIEYRKELHFQNSTDSMPIIHYLYDTAANYPPYKSMIDSTGYMVDYLSTLYGRYPFWQEKYGHCLAPLGGGMEHQTMTTIGASQTYLVAHELGHQWFGDHVTYGTWRDIWLSEGWASYTEQLYIEHFWSVAAAMAYRTAVFNRIMVVVGGSVYVDDTTSVNRIFDSRLTYDKGAAVAHMLRYLAPDDNTFFTALRNYQQLYSFKTAVTPQFKAVLEQAYGYSLDSFFNQWVYGEGFPTYAAKWNQGGNTVMLQLNQTTSKPSSVALFSLPVEVKFSSATGDTVVKFYNDQAQQFYAFTWSKTVTSVTIDPNNNIVNRTGLIAKDPQLAVGSPALNDVRIFPNPAKDSWQVTHLPAHTGILLADMNGKTIWQLNNAGDTVVIPANNLAAGQYMVSFYQSGKLAGSRLLQRK